MAASQFGFKRIIVMADEGFMSMFPTLLANSLTWLKESRSGSTSFALHRGVQAIANILSETSFQVVVVGAGVYVTDV